MSNNKGQSTVFKIKKFLATKAETSAFWNRAYYSGKYTTAQLMCKVYGEEKYAHWFYKVYTGKELDLDNPTYFNEKMWWLKLHNHNPLMTICSDKNAVREYVRNKGYEDILIPQLDLLPSAKELQFEKYQEECIVKCTHNSGGHIFWNPQNPLTKKEQAEARRFLQFLLNHNAYVLSREWNYKNIKPQIVVDKVIRDKNGNLPSDYRFFCFDGVPKLLMMDIGTIDKDGNHSLNFYRNIYDMDFNLLPIYWGHESKADIVKKPKTFEEMKVIAAALSEPFPACRVDLYNVDEKILFGEITFYHSGASQNFEPEEWDLRMGSWIDLNSSKIIQERNTR